MCVYIIYYILYIHIYTYIYTQGKNNCALRSLKCALNAQKNVKRIHFPIRKTMKFGLKNLRGQLSFWEPFRFLISFFYQNVHHYRDIEVYF